MTKDSFPVYLAFDCHAVLIFFLEEGGTLQRVMLSFYTLLLCVTSRGRLVFLQRFLSGCLPEDTKDGGSVEGTDRCRYCGTQCQGKLMYDFPASVAQRPLRIASQLTFSSQLAYSNHTHHKGLPLHETPFQARYQTSGSV